MAICKYYPIVANFFASVINLSAKADDLSRKFSNGNASSKDSPFKQGSNRQYSTVTVKERPLGLRVDPIRDPGREEIYTSSIPLTANHGKPMGVKKGFSQSFKGFKQSLYHSSLLRLNFNVNNIPEYLLVKGGTGAMNILKGITLFTGTRHSVSAILYLICFARTCHNLLVTQGRPGLVKFLKACGVSLQQSLGGHKVRDCGSLGSRVSRTNSGIPRWIPVRYRILIRNGDPRAIRLTLTLINIFRVIEFPGKLKLETITAASTATDSLNQYLKGMIPLFVKLFVFSRFTREQLSRKLRTFANKSVIPMFKGGPGAPGYLGLWNTHPTVLVKALLGLRAQRKL